MITLEKAREAKKTLRSTVRSQPWYRGIGLMKGVDGYEILIQVARGMLAQGRSAVPQSWEGVCVTLRETDDALAQSSD